MIRDDDLYDLLVKGCPDGVHMVSLMDCCHSGTYIFHTFRFLESGYLNDMLIFVPIGTIMDLPYIFKADGEQTEMILDPDLDVSHAV